MRALLLVMIAAMTLSLTACGNKAGLKSPEQIATQQARQARKDAKDAKAQQAPATPAPTPVPTPEPVETPDPAAGS